MGRILKITEPFVVLKFSLLTMVFLLTTLMCQKAFASEQIGKAAKVINKVFAGGLNYRLKMGEKININEKIITGEASGAKLDFIDGSSLMLGDDTRIVLKQLAFNSVKNKVTGSFQLLVGVIRFTSGNTEMKFKINTPNASIGLIGTSFEVLASKRTTEIFCREGNLLVEHKKGTKRMEPGNVFLVSTRGEVDTNGTSTAEMSSRITEMLSMLNQVTVLNDTGGTKKFENSSGSVAAKISPLRTVGSKKYLEMALDYGLVKIKLRPDLAPKHVNRIKELVALGFYDGLEFFNVRPGYVVESGSPKNSYLVGSGKNLIAEFSSASFVRGTVGMTRLANDPDSADSQFFVTLRRAPKLDNKYTIWGEVISGINILDNLSPGSPPKNPDKIISLRVVD